MNILKYFLSALILGFLTLGITSCGDTFDNRREIDYSLAPDPFPTTGADKIDKESGLSYYLIEEGSGDLSTEIRDGVQVFITGRVYGTDIIFDSSYGDQNPAPRSYGSIANIGVQGLREGLLDMKEGEKRVLIVPPEIGNNNPLFRYRNDTLRYDIELDEILL